MNMTTPLSIIVVLMMALSGYLIWRQNRLERSVTHLMVDATYGVLTRNGLDLRWRQLGAQADRLEVVFFDLDELHAANERYGYADVDRRIRAALQVRASDLCVARWYSGDELVIVVGAGDGHGAAERILARLRANGLSATFGVVPAQRHLAQAVMAASRKVQSAKALGLRGTIN